MRKLMMPLLAALLLSPGALAGTETHGGHIVMSEGGKAWLRDLVDRTSCRWLTGASFSRQVKGFPEVLAKIKKGHSYFGELVEGQLAQVRVCLTEGRIRPVPEADQDIFLPYYIEGRQLAARVWLEDDSKSIVFIDTAYYEQLSEDQRPYLWMHELAHGLIPFSSSLRSIRLRSLVASLYGMRDQADYLQEDLQLLLEASLIARGGLEDRLVAAARSGDLAGLKEALRLGAKPLQTEAFYHAMIGGHLEAAKLLLPLLHGDTLPAGDSVTEGYLRYCKNKDLTTSGGLWAPSLEKLPAAYQHLVVLGCRRPANLKALAELLFRLPGVDWAERVYLADTGTLVTVLTVHSSPDLANLMLDRKLIQEVPEAGGLVSKMWWWLASPSGYTSTDNVGYEMKTRRGEYYKLYKRLGGKDTHPNARPAKPSRSGR